MKVTVEMFDGEQREYTDVEEVNFRTDFDRIIIFQDNWKKRTIIPLDSFISYTETT